MIEAIPAASLAPPAYRASNLSGPGASLSNTKDPSWAVRCCHAESSSAGRRPARPTGEIAVTSTPMDTVSCLSKSASKVVPLLTVLNKPPDAVAM